VSNTPDQLAKGPPNQRGQIAAAVAAAVDEVPNIERSKSLMLSTLYPKGRIDGVVLSAQQVTVHILIDPSRYGDDLRRKGESARRAAQKALRALGDERPVFVRIDDFLPVPAPAPGADS
jgi:hypothetical protein